MKHFFFLFFLIGSIQYSFASDWLTHLHDGSRSASTHETLSFPLHPAWTFESSAPRYAWDDPALQDFWQRAFNLKPRVIFDRAHYVVSAKQKVYFGSTVDDHVYCIDANSGVILWRFATHAPVRLPPSLHADKLYAGSDDGKLYCLDAQSGELIWEYTASAEKRLIPGNERIISPWAIRTGVLIDKGIAYFASGMFPEEKVYLCALNAATGKEIWKKQIAYSPQGHLLASSTHLFVPTGCSTPIVFRKEDGEFVKELAGFGGSYAVLAEDQLTYGPGRTGQLSSSSTETQNQLATFSGNHMIVTPEASYLHTDTELSAINRNEYRQHKDNQTKLNRHKQSIESKITQAKQDRDEEMLRILDKALRSAQTTISDNQTKIEQTLLWNIPCAHSYSLILAGNTLIAGGQDTVAAYNTQTGSEVWRGAVRGKAYGLAVANGKLFVSTDLGYIHGFSSQTIETVPSVTSLGQHQIQFEPQKASDVFPQKGYAVLAGWDEYKIENLLTSTELHIAIVEKNEEQVHAARSWLLEHNVYGSRAVVFVGSVSDLGFTDYFANLVVFSADDVSRQDMTDLESIVKPSGGLVYIKIQQSDDKDAVLKMFAGYKQSQIDWTTGGEAEGHYILERSALPHIGEWTHLYADAGNTASSKDQTINQNLRIQWFGRPGPRLMIDRHLRPPSPLAKDGRLFIPANDKVIAADAYNGTKLWQVDLPGFRRVGIPYDTGNMVLTDQHLYAVVDEVCLGLDAATGKQDFALQLPEASKAAYPKHEWGYVAHTNGVIIGTAQSPEASRTEMSRDDIAEQYNTFRPLVTSDTIFAYLKNGHRVLWNHPKTKIINTTIAANSSSVFMIECVSPALQNVETGRIPLSKLTSGKTFLTSFDLRSGETAFRNEIDIQHLQHIVYTSCTEDMVIVTGSFNNKETHSVWYSVMAFDAKTGKPLWQQQHENNRKGVGGDHGEQVHHPVVLADKIIAEPVAYEIATGKRIEEDGAPWYIPSRGGCGTVSGSSNCLFYRNSNPMIFDFNTGHDPKPLSSVNRPGCWINMIPAGGLVLVPEASSGCTCNFSIQTSMAFLPVH